MKRTLASILAAITLITSGGCSEAVNLEELTIALIVGLDLDQSDRLSTHIMSPVFKRTRSGTTHYSVSKENTIRSSRNHIDLMTMGNTVGGKTEVILIGERLLEEEDWFILFDVFYRDAQNSLTAKVIAVDGEVSDIMEYDSEDMPILPLYISSLLETAENRKEIINTNLQQLDKLMNDKAVTPFIPVIKRTGDALEISSMLLLDKAGKPVLSLAREKIVLLSMLQNANLAGKGEVTLSVPVQNERKQQTIGRGTLLMTVNRLKVKIKPDYANGNFQFNISIQMAIALKERYFPYDIEEHRNELEQRISEQLTAQFNEIIKQCQQKNVDPFGFGRYARAYRNKQWKTVEEHWGEAFSHAKMDLTVHTQIKYMGPVK